MGEKSDTFYKNGTSTQIILSEELKMVNKHFRHNP